MSEEPSASGQPVENQQSAGSGEPSPPAPDRDPTAEATKGSLSDDIETDKVDRGTLQARYDGDAGQDLSIDDD